MEPVQPFIMPQYKCKKCGKIVSEPHLQSFNISYENWQCHGRWCLCDDCIAKGVARPQCADAFLSELADIISKYKVNPRDVFYEE